MSSNYKNLVGYGHGKDMVRKRAIRKVAPAEGQYISNLYLIGKKGGGTVQG